MASSASVSSKRTLSVLQSSIVLYISASVIVGLDGLSENPVQSRSRGV
jgi:hypothetical protein